MNTIRSMVSQILAGELQVDVSTAEAIIKTAAKDKSIDLASELAPVRDLFQHGVTAKQPKPVDPRKPTTYTSVDSLTGKTTQGTYEVSTPEPELVGDLKPSVKFTQSGKKMLQAFLYNAQKIFDEHGSSRSKDVKGLRDLACINASKLTSEEELLKFLDNYKGATLADDPGTRYTHAHIASYAVESKRLNAFYSLENYLRHGPLYRFFIGEATKARLENDPLQKVREYLEGNYEHV